MWTEEREKRDYGQGGRRDLGDVDAVVNSGRKHKRFEKGRSRIGVYARKIEADVAQTRGEFDTHALWVVDASVVISEDFTFTC